MQQGDSLVPGFMIVHGNRLESLRHLVVNWLARNPLSPLENEVMLVQSNGIAQWLKQALAADVSTDESGGCGIAAAIDVQLPARFMWQAYRGVLGKESVPETSPLDKQPLTWRLMRLLPALIDAPAFEPLRRFLKDDDDCRKRYQLAVRLADLFDQYQVYRADWLADWSAGRDQLRQARDGIRPLEAADLWQPALWRALLADVGEAHLSDSRAGIHPRFVAALGQASQRPDALPRRVVVFGISSLPAQYVEALAAMGRHCQILLCVLNPCQHHWGDIIADQDLLRHQYRRQARRPGAPLHLDEHTLHQHAHPLLAAWGKQGRDYINLLDSHDEQSEYRAAFEPINGGRIDLFDEPDTAALLGQLQDDIRDLRPLQETRARWPAVNVEADASIRFHIAHSAQREVEILHDQLLHALDSDRTLRPRDIIVMMPDVDSYAPHVQAVFGQHPPGDPRHIPFSLADQGQRGQEPLLIALEHLLRLPESRLPVSEILDLLDVPAVRERFGLREADLPTLQRWIEGAGIRWGLDETRRTALGMPPGLEATSWRFGLRRMLLGYAAGQSLPWADIEPYDEIGGLDAALIGPLSDLLHRLDQHERALAEPAAPSVWGERLRALLADFFTVHSERDQLLHAQLLEGLAGWLELCETVDLHEPLPLNVVAEAWLDGVGQSQLSQRFLGGAVSVCTLMPMRAIPFRRVCLLGMNDGDYPRAQPPLDFDLMGRDYRPGDRSRREDDRYLLLEALLSARDSLYVSWVGRSIRDNSARPPSVLIGQLRDHLHNGWQSAGEAGLLESLTTEHPLQPFSRSYFDEQSPLFSYASDWVRLHTNSAQTPVNTALPPLHPDGPIELIALQRFLRHPVEHFFAARLKVWLSEDEVVASDDEPFALGGLQRHQLSQELLETLQDAPVDADLQTLIEKEAVRLQQRGRLPLAGFGDLTRGALIEPLHDQLVRYREQAQRWDRLLEHPLPLFASAPGIELRSWLAGARESSSVSGQMRLRLVTGNLLAGRGKTMRWRKMLNELSLHVLAAASGHALATTLFAADATIRLQPLDTQQAQGMVGDWLLGWLEGLRRPLPVEVETAFVLLCEDDPAKALSKARSQYDGSDFSLGEVRKSVALQRSYPDFASLLASEEFEGWVEALYRPLARAAHDGWLECVPVEERGHD
ncbi:exodeoxyribonuclease V subunit gamma [Halopseudomonas nanhaiensis]|uniref:exodeoxyribonuclease V subunit gamma n=1 Tax=Halopseudomonas nanhaiensis TaxID=2830842 RepID=UPI001CBE0C5A|nr:exodeoxyribonuclease V subunit gamma [Halopseudomonas nanhaiensis]UAW98058.1 exodeoxyribonuclease V subunit gamma [Halopseudomonas nanhaiensis]